MFLSFSRPTILLWIVSLFLYYGYSLPNPITSNETDRLALLAIKSQLHDPLGFTSSWNNSISLCQWRGITCGRRHQRVTVLDLRNQSIRGALSPSIGNLTFLRVINLEDNNFYGEIPYEVGRLFRLESLALDNNSFSGTIPTNLSGCSNLFELYLYNNNLTGEIPMEVGYLLKLVILSLYSNYLTGQIASSFGNLSALQSLDLGSNNFGGRLPDYLGQLRSLKFFSVEENYFSGMVPPSLYNISSLRIFVLEVNSFNGTLPPNIGLTLPNLRVINVYKNNFTENIPTSFSNTSDLSELDLGNNHFNGKVLIDFSRLENLGRLNLDSNNLGNGRANDLDFVTLLTNCSKLERIILVDNQFAGILPHSIANLSTKMTTLAISYNQISGTIPSGIGNLVGLTGLGMESNHLTSSIPQAIGQLKNLELLDLHKNYFRGSIPISLGNLSLLTSLALSHNKLEGYIPSSLGNCQNLLELYLAENKLTGFVPPQLLGITTLSIILDLSDNHLSGPFPSNLNILNKLIELDISGNQFSSWIPITLGACTSLEYLHMERNSFIGSIPSSLSSLKSIKELDLSFNNLSGQIPQYIEDLSFLEYLNLSYNHFEGEVPTKGVFSNSTEVILTGNGKLCGGPANLHLPICHFKGSKKPTISLLKVVIPVILSCLTLSLCFIVVYIRRRKTSRKSSGMSLLQEHFPMVSYAELSKATNEFSSSNMIGKGGCGYVYKGILGDSEMLVAVKVLNLEQSGASKSFMAECEALRNIRHRNLIKIITVCSSIDFKGSDFKALVYEYMQNGSLEEWLYHINDQTLTRNLSLLQGLNIAIDVASAIEYLHHDCHPPIVHGDLKPSNVLLDQDMVAHVSDFGLARFLGNRPLNIAPANQSSSIGIKGTVGYVAPEYGMGGEVSMLADVYSFGILLLEMFTRRRPTDSMFKDGLTLHEFAKMALSENVTEIIEPSLLSEVRVGILASHGDERVRIEECFISICRIGVLCSMESSTERMVMRDVVAKLCATRRKFLNNRN